MRIARVTGTVTATIKAPHLSAFKLLLMDIEDGSGAVIDAAIVAVDTLGAGVGDRVLVVTGSAARIPSEVAGLAIDATTVAIIDTVSIDA